MTTTEQPVVTKRAYKKKAVPKAATKAKSTNASKKASTAPVKTTVITVAPDGIITITKTEETVSDLLGVK
jgi:hypothetical protein